MLSTLITGGALIGAMATEVIAPDSIEKGEAQIDFPPTTFAYSSIDDNVAQVLEMKKEAENIQYERDELARQLEEEKLRLEKLRVEQEKKKAEEKEVKRLAELKKKVEVEGQTFNASYYTPYCTGCSGITKTGVNVKNNIKYQGMTIIAADPNVIPLYSIVEISSNKGTYRAIVLDTGGAIKGKKLDILVKDKKTAYALGRHDVKVKIVRKGK